MKINTSYSIPLFFAGAGRLLDWGGQFELYRSAGTAAIADEDALASDWNAVGELLCEAIEEYRVSEAA